MNKGYAMGFISSDIKTENITTKDGNTMLKAKFSVACQRKGKNAGADFPWFEALGKNAEFINTWWKKGKGIMITYHIQTGSYTNKDGKTIYTETKLVDEAEFLPIRKDEESTPVSEMNNDGNKSNSTHAEDNPPAAPDFVNIPEDIDLNDDLPFK